MKKVIFSMMAASVMLASCSNEEALEVNKGRAIEFRHGMKSRAADLNTGNLESFKVSAYVGSDLYFGGVDFTKGDGDTFSSGTSYYWPGDGSKVNFTSFAPADLANATINNGSVSVSDFVVKDTNAEQIDFLFGSASGTRANETTGVEMKFSHMLSQIEIKAKSGNETYDFEISEVKIVNIPNQGSFNGSAWTITDGADKATYSCKVSPAVTLGATESPLMTKMVGDSVTNNNLILIPQQLEAWEPTENRTPAVTADNAKNLGAYIAVKLKVTSKQGGVQIFPFETKDENSVTLTSAWAAVPVGTNWESGKKYTYILDFTSGAGWVAPEEPIDPEEPILSNPITFSVEVSNWDTEDETQSVDMDTDKK